MLYLELRDFLLLSMPVKFSEWIWSWSRAELVGSSCGFGFCDASSAPPPFDRISIMLTAMLQLCSWFRWWNISRARWLLCAFISWVVFFAPQLLRWRSIKPTFSGRDRTSIHYSSLSHTHTHVNTHCNNPHGHINKCWIACLISSG